MRHKFVILAVIGLLSAPIAAFAQQTGALVGKATAPDGSGLPGVTVEARADVLPGPRTTVTGSNGEYRLPALPPGTYTVTFTLSGMQTVTRTALVQLALDTTADAKLAVQGVTETVTVTAFSSLLSQDAASLSNGLSNATIQSLPVGQEYRDLLKLIPGVMFTQDGTRGPSAGGSGQDNVYQFDGVNVTLPLFGTLSAEPSTHDIAQVSTIRGGAKAINFNRSGGFTIDSVSKSGTSRYAGMLSFQLQNSRMAANLTNKSLISRYEQDRTWITVNAGGPIIPNRLFFYGSYYRPEVRRDNRGNVYGDLPDYRSTRQEGFGKLTATPRQGVLLNASYKNSHRLDKSNLFGGFSAQSTGTGNESWQETWTADGSWIIDSRSFATFKWNKFEDRNQSRPDNEAAVTISTAVGTQLDIANLDKIGLLSVPLPIAGQTAFNAFIQPLIDSFGYISSTTGLRTGGGLVGYGSLFDKDNFFRDSWQAGYNLTLGSHDLHFGYQRYTDGEDLTRSSNGWGSITVSGGRINFPTGPTGTPIFYTAAFQQQGVGIPTIHSEYRSEAFEANDQIRWNEWSFNLGVLVSHDTLYGQGLSADPNQLSGYVGLRGNPYKMYEVPWKKLIQPRFAVTRSVNGTDTVYASYAKYNPAATSLPRAASWDRNLATTINAHFDAAGRLFATTPIASSSGKLFVPDMTPRTIHEFLIGTSFQINDKWSARAYARYRSAGHFWEDTENDSRVRYAPPTGIPRDLYIPQLTAMRTQIGSGSTYVIAELDGAFTKYYEATVESEWRSGKTSLRGSYTWSHYYGNFDQDSTTTGNDANIFVGSSFIADAAGRQLWNFREGDLRGDRRHVLKVYGNHEMPWRGNVGIYAIAQSGQPWEAWSYEPYIALTTSTSDTSRFAEPAGTRITPMHYQLDLKYTQSIPMGGRYSFQLVADMFNVFNKQTGHNFQNSVHSAAFGQPRSYFEPRRFQLAGRFTF